MAVKKFSKNTEGDKKLSPHFTVSEFACKDGSDTILIDTMLVYYLEKIRDHFGKSITINSAYRSPSYNAAVGGASESLHMNGMAGGYRDPWGHSTGDCGLCQCTRDGWDRDL